MRSSWPGKSAEFASADRLSLTGNRKATRGRSFSFRRQGRFTKLASTRTRQTRERARGTRESIFTEFTERSRVRARVGSRALPIKFRGLTRRRYARSTKADNSILHRSREKGSKRGRKGECMERHGVVFRRGNPGLRRDTLSRDSICHSPSDPPAFSRHTSSFPTWLLQGGTVRTRLHAPVRSAHRREPINSTAVLSEE